MTRMNRKQIKRREFLKQSCLAATATVALGACTSPPPPASANSRIQLAVIGLGRRGKVLLNRLHAETGAQVRAVCDADTAQIEATDPADLRDIQTYQDYRAILDRQDIDAVVLATPNHWHAPMTIMACQAGKHVYVEKPVSHTISEGRLMVETARRTGRIVQAGTQQRSCPAPIEVARDIRSGRFGNVREVHCLNLGLRESIGRVTSPQDPPSTVDYNLWSGPAPAAPILRQQFHYDWHWQWNWGSGEIGNWLVHFTDDLCHLLGWDTPPSQVVSAGGRFVWNDNGETPNMLFALMEREGLPVVLEIRDLPHTKGRKAPSAYQGARSGNLIRCDEALIKISRGAGKAYTPDGKKEIASYSGNAGAAHLTNFIESIRSGKSEDLNADISGGHLSATLCHLANISHRLGETNGPATTEKVIETFSHHPDALRTAEAVLAQIERNGGDLSQLVLGPTLNFDPKTESFHGPHGEAANAFLRYEMREEFAVM